MRRRQTRYDFVGQERSTNERRGPFSCCSKWVQVCPVSSWTQHLVVDHDNLYSQVHEQRHPSIHTEMNVRTVLFQSFFCVQDIILNTIDACAQASWQTSFSRNEQLFFSFRCVPVGAARSLKDCLQILQMLFLVVQNTRFVVKNFSIGENLGWIGTCIPQMKLFCVLCWEGQTCWTEDFVPQQSLKDQKLEFSWQRGSVGAWCVDTNSDAEERPSEKHSAERNSMFRPTTGRNCHCVIAVGWFHAYMSCTQWSLDAIFA